MRKVGVMIIINKFTVLLAPIDNKPSQSSIPWNQYRNWFPHTTENLLLPSQESILFRLWSSCGFNSASYQHCASTANVNTCISLQDQKKVSLVIAAWISRTRLFWSRGHNLPHGRQNRMNVSLLAQWWSSQESDPWAGRETSSIVSIIICRVGGYLIKYALVT